VFENESHDQNISASEGRSQPASSRATQGVSLSLGARGGTVGPAASTEW